MFSFLLPSDVGSIWRYSGSSWGCFWVEPGVDAGWISDRLRVGVWPTLGLFGVFSGSMLGRFGVEVGAICGRAWIRGRCRALGRFVIRLGIDFGVTRRTGSPGGSPMRRASAARSTSRALAAPRPLAAAPVACRGASAPSTGRACPATGPPAPSGGSAPRPGPGTRTARGIAGRGRRGSRTTTAALGRGLELLRRRA